MFPWILNAQHQVETELSDIVSPLQDNKKDQLNNFKLHIVNLDFYAKPFLMTFALRGFYSHNSVH